MPDRGAVREEARRRKPSIRLATQPFPGPRRCRLLRWGFDGLDLRGWGEGSLIQNVNGSRY